MQATRAPDRQSSAASMTVHTALDMSSIRRSVDLTTRGDRQERSPLSLSLSLWPEEEGEREIASVRQVVLHSRMASITRQKKSVGRMQEARQAEEGGAASAGLVAASIRTTVSISRTTATATATATTTTTTTTTMTTTAATGRSHHQRTVAGALPPAIR